MPYRLHRFLDHLAPIIVGFILALALFSGCAPGTNDNKNDKVYASKSIKIETGQILTVQQVRTFYGIRAYKDSLYEAVNSEWLDKALGDWHYNLSLTVPQWNEKFDCDKAAEDFHAWAIRQWFVKTFHSFTKAQSPAIGVYSFVWDETRPKGTAGKGHAVIVAITEKGVMYIDAFTKQKLVLTPQELSAQNHIATEF